MAICKDCIHYDVCERWARNVEEEFCVVATLTPCEIFKNKADVVEVKHSQWVANHTEWVSKGNEYISKSTIVPYNEDLDSCEHSSPFCLNCGTDAIYNGAGDFEITKYCHNCGAKMDLVGD